MNLTSPSRFDHQAAVWTERGLGVSLTTRIAGPLDDEEVAFVGRNGPQQEKRRQGIGPSRADLERQRTLEQLAGAANSAASSSRTRAAAAARRWWRGAEPGPQRYRAWAEFGWRGNRLIGAVEGDFPEDDVPIFLLGACGLVDATWAVIGLDPLRDVLDYLGPRLDVALAELDCTLQPAGKVLAETLIRAAAGYYRLDEEPADAETMRQLGGKSWATRWSA